MNRTWPITNQDVSVYRARRYTPGHSKVLARRLGSDCVVASMRNPPRSGLIFNYGRTTTPVWFNPDTMEWLNDPANITNASDKLRCFELLRDARVPTLPWVDGRIEGMAEEVAREWGGETVYARATATGRKGQGITVCRPGDPIPPAMLYTLGRPERTEYRVHVFQNKIIDVTQKKRYGAEKLARMGLTSANEDVRNRAGGWVYGRKDVRPKQQTLQVAADAVRACGLDFGGVDVFEYEGAPSEVCEINTAPGMRTKCLDAYVAATAIAALSWRQDRHDG